MRPRSPSVRRARRHANRLVTGFVVTWDVDSSDSAACSRLRRFIFGKTVDVDGRTYRYPGFVEKEGVSYVGQSVLFVRRERLAELVAFLHRESIPHVVRSGTIGGVVPC